MEEEPVLLIPMVLALLEDNPMQSEFACHIGLRGKFFCRVCWVKGHDSVGVAEKGKGQPETNNEDLGSEAGSEAGSEVGSEVSETEENTTPAKKGKGRRNKITESLSGLVRRAKDFIKVCHPGINCFLSLKILPDWTASSQG